MAVFLIQVISLNADALLNQYSPFSFSSFLFASLRNPAYLSSSENFGGLGKIVATWHAGQDSSKVYLLQEVH